MTTDTDTNPGVGPQRMEPFPRAQVNAYSGKLLSTWEDGEEPQRFSSGPAQDASKTSHVTSFSGLKRSVSVHKDTRPLAKVDSPRRSVLGNLDIHAEGRHGSWIKAQSSFSPKPSRKL